MRKYNILHYTVGLNKNRGGGLTKYVDDLVEFQKKNNNVFVLYPGKIELISKKIRIKREKSDKKINIYSIINPLPLPMMFGIRCEDYINKKSDIEIWKRYLKDNRIDIIHMHTLMGIYEEFIDAANELEIPIIYTTHDYFGICPKQTLFYNGEICKNYNSCINCPECNLMAFSKKKYYIIHSNFFKRIRRLKVFKIMKSKKKEELNIISNKKNIEYGRYNIDFYIKLKQKILCEFKKIDYFHFNSSITRDIFKRILPTINGEVINITHKDIKDHRKIRKYDNKKLRILYLGPSTTYKGFNSIIDSLDNIYVNNQNIELTIYSYSNIKRPYIIEHVNGYKYDEMPDIFDKTDILIAPSKMYETFGFTVAEALSFGMPVIVSKNIGAKDLVIDKKTGYVINNKDLENTIVSILNNKEELISINKNICKYKFTTFNEHCDIIQNLYIKTIKNKKEK